MPDYFELLSFRVIDERRFNAKGELVTTSEATIKVSVGGKHFYTVADGNGPVNALDHALRQALAETYPTLERMQLLDYKVRILAPEQGTAAVTRVIIESGDGEGRVWQTVGVSGNIIDASYAALHDAITYQLFIDGARAPGRMSGPPAAPAVILCRTQMGENIGTAARAMLNFGLTELRLVAPQCGWPNAKAVVAASGAVDVLNRDRGVPRPRRRHGRPAPHAGDHRPAARDRQAGARAPRRPPPARAAALARAGGSASCSGRSAPASPTTSCSWPTRWSPTRSTPPSPRSTSPRPCCCSATPGSGRPRATRRCRSRPRRGERRRPRPSSAGLVDHLVRELDAVELLPRRGAPGQPDPRRSR